MSTTVPAISTVPLRPLIFSSTSGQRDVDISRLGLSKGHRVARASPPKVGEGCGGPFWTPRSSLDAPSGRPLGILEAPSGGENFFGARGVENFLDFFEKIGLLLKKNMSFC